MIITYNKNNEDMITTSPEAKQPGIYGFPKYGKLVEPGGILFRQKNPGRILGPDLQTINETQNKIIRDQINSSFMLFGRETSLNRSGD
jgi:hypothetical protein